MPQPAHAAVNETEQPRRIRFLREILICLGIIVGLNVFFTLFIGRAYGIPSGSMESTLLEGDRIISEKVTIPMSGISAGDIVTFKDPTDPSVTLIKRCIATEGQTIDLRGGDLYVDNVKMEEDYTNGQPTYKQDSDIRYPYKVPEGCIWVMGDNRQHSSDSRTFGAVPVSSVTGKAVAIYWPPNRIGVLN